MNIYYESCVLIYLLFDQTLPSVMGLDLSREWGIGAERTKSPLFQFLLGGLIIAAAGVGAISLASARCCLSHLVEVSKQESAVPCFHRGSWRALK